jgi:hypothetical protein
MNANTGLMLLNRSSEQQRMLRKSLERHLTCGASYKPPALPGDTYLSGALMLWSKIMSNTRVDGWHGATSSRFRLSCDVLLSPCHS